jgi:hypothetical protein
MRGYARVDPQFLRFGALNLFSTDLGIPRGGFMNKMSRSDRRKNVLNPQVGEPWARADLLFLKMSLAEIAGFLRRTADEVREKAKRV